MSEMPEFHVFATAHEQWDESDILLTQPVFTESTDPFEIVDEAQKQHNLEGRSFFAVVPTSAIEWVERHEQ